MRWPREKSLFVDLGGTLVRLDGDEVFLDGAGPR